jgi:hypothetical protein
MSRDMRDLSPETYVLRSDTSPSASVTVLALFPLVGFPIARAACIRASRRGRTGLGIGMGVLAGFVLPILVLRLADPA